MSEHVCGDDRRLAKLCKMCQKLTGTLDEGNDTTVKVELSYYTDPRNVEGTETTNCPICICLFYEIRDNPLSKLQPEVYH